MTKGAAFHLASLFEMEKQCTVCVKYDKQPNERDDDNDDDNSVRQRRWRQHKTHTHTHAHRYCDHKVCKVQSDDRKTNENKTRRDEEKNTHTHSSIYRLCIFTDNLGKKNAISLHLALDALI